MLAVSDERAISAAGRTGAAAEVRTIGRYALLDELARGGMATVHAGRLVGPAGFGRTVAIKRLHPHLATDEDFVTMLLDEARLVGRIQHPNVVGMLDVVTLDREVLLVMELVDGETLFRLLRESKKRGVLVPIPIASAILVDTLRGLHAAHEAKGERGEPLDLVHRDFTPHNIMIRRDGTSLVVDFGIAKAVGRMHTTEEGRIKGKLPYMAPEQVRGGKLTRRVDVYAAGAVLWEAIVGERMVRGQTEAEVLERLLFAEHEAPSSRREGVSPALDAIVMRALARSPDERFATAAEMARALEEAAPPALPSRVADWLQDLVGDALVSRAERLAELERRLADHDPTGTSTKLDAARPAPEITPHVASSAKGAQATAQAAPSPTPTTQPPTTQSTAQSAPVSAGTEPALVQPIPAARSAPARRVWVVAVVALAAVGVASSWIVRASATAKDPPASSASDATSASALLAPTQAPAASISTPDPSASAASIASSSPRASASGAPLKAPSQGGDKRPRTPAKKPRCAPVTIDANGNKQYHPECMTDDP